MTTARDREYKRRDKLLLHRYHCVVVYIFFFEFVAFISGTSRGDRGTQRV